MRQWSPEASELTQRVCKLLYEYCQLCITDVICTLLLCHNSSLTMVSYQNESDSSKWEVPFLPPSPLELWGKERARRQLSFWWNTLILMRHYSNRIPFRAKNYTRTRYHSPKILHVSFSSGKICEMVELYGAWPEYQLQSAFLYATIFFKIGSINKESDLTEIKVRQH